MRFNAREQKITKNIYLLLKILVLVEENSFIIAENTLLHINNQRLIETSHQNVVLP